MIVRTTNASVAVDVHRDCISGCSIDGRGVVECPDEPHGNQILVICISKSPRLKR